MAEIIKDNHFHETEKFFGATITIDHEIVQFIAKIHGMDYRSIIEPVMASAMGA